MNLLGTILVGSGVAIWLIGGGIFWTRRQRRRIQEDPPKSIQEKLTVITRIPSDEWVLLGALAFGSTLLMILGQYLRGEFH